MALPADLATVTVTGDYRDLGTGNPATGSVIFSTSLFVVDAAFKTTLLPTTKTATLSSGTFSIVLPATNDPQTSPVYTWLVTESFTGIANRAPYSVSIDYTLGTVDITALAPISAAAATAGYLLSSQYGGVGGIPGPLDSLGHLPALQIPYNIASGVPQLGADGKIPENLLPDSIPRIIEANGSNVYPLRATFCSSATAVAIWYGVNDPTFGGAGYALAHDIWIQKT